MNKKIKLRTIIIFIIILLAIFTLTFINNTTENKTSPDQSRLTTITIISVGDIFIHQSVLDAVYDKSTKQYDFTPCFEDVHPYLQNADIATAWFGGVLDSTGSYYGYPSFKTPQTLASAMKDAGFDIVFRTNHTMDYGERGLKKTTAILNKYSIEQIGAYISEEASKNIYVFQKNGLKMSFLSYTYGMNDIPIPKSWMVNLIDTLKIREDILSAKELSDFVIVALHFGTEYERYPNREQKQIIKTITNAGADLIIGSHPHVIQPVDIVDDRVYVAYSLGNFLCGQRMQYCDAGVMLKYTIVKDNDSAYLKQISYIPTWNAKYLGNENYKFKILPITKSTLINKENYPYLSKDNLARMAQAFQETVQHLEKPDINFACEE